MFGIMGNYPTFDCTTTITYLQDSGGDALGLRWIADNQGQLYNLKVYNSPDNILPYTLLMDLGNFTFSNAFPFIFGIGSYSTYVNTYFKIRATLINSGTVGSYSPVVQLL